MRRSHSKTCYTTYYKPPKRKENDINSGYGVLMYDPFPMENYIQHHEDPNVRLAAVMDIVPHAINRFTQRCLKPEGKTGYDIHKKLENMLLRWRHFDVLADMYGDKTAYSFGYLVYFFEMACAISGYMLGVNPFNQPGVESYKKNMFALLGKKGYEERKAELEKRLG